MRKQAKKKKINKFVGFFRIRQDAFFANYFFLSYLN